MLGRLRRARAISGLRNEPAQDEADAEYRVPDIDPQPDQQKKLKVFAKIIGTSERRAAAELYQRMFAYLPERPLEFFLLADMKIRSCEQVGDDLLRIELNHGRIFLGQRSNAKEYALHNAFRRYLPQIVTGDAYKLALDVQRRYWRTELSWYNSNGGVLVEGGCFTGMKAIRWHDLSPKPARILAIEIGETNARILDANIRANGLDSAITAVHAGLWRETGEGTQKHDFSTRRFLETSDRWEQHMQHEEKVRLLTVGALLDECAVDVADYFNIQVNGAEIEVLGGADFDRVKVFDIAAYYSQDGKKNADVVREMLTARGCTVLHESPLGRIAAVTPKFRDEIMALKPREKGKRRRG
jgi:FkbM family methyltransferase